ncbi:hypothetical protein A584_00240 [Pseudomonas syringae pv. theae ICMP 3923]|nr:hypothetical protein [Pseudomonas syringae]EPM73604.1 hypothetical protein A584_00240 [Pseudomonas syringae pv. theae ICMP 3923]MBL3828813.1 hypothetical protein [Pseudomonas syringae pv. theae]MBL3838072.1 hypothetical protein [Pseudomonas syringae pv. theae]MBL3867645.1 hypothetical protein [Pseudomonas syringae pv. theae]MBL3873014.1 hypothetical protein [Pseudomonas syringae pv. theae]
MKQDIQQQLATAKAELESWEQQALTRNDGSQAQDRRFEEIGERLQERVGELARQLAGTPD